MAQYFLSSSYLLRQSKISLPFIKLVNPSNVSEASLKNTVFDIILCGAFRTRFQNPLLLCAVTLHRDSPRRSLLFLQTVQSYKPKCNTIHAWEKYMYGFCMYFHVTQKHLMALCSIYSNKLQTNRNINMESTNRKSLCF